MGQTLLNPPSVEGWHQGVEWIETGSLIERLNFASQQLGDMEKPGVRALIQNIMADKEAITSAKKLVDRCLDQLGAIEVSPDTKSVLVEFAENQLPASDSVQPLEGTKQKISELLRLVATVPEFQRV